MTDETAQALIAELRALREEMARQRPAQALPPNTAWAWRQYDPTRTSSAKCIGIGERFPDGTICLPQN